jgi:hypothetical protein
MVAGMHDEGWGRSVEIRGKNRGSSYGASLDALAGGKVSVKVVDPQDADLRETIRSSVRSLTLPDHRLCRRFPHRHGFAFLIRPWSRWFGQSKLVPCR